MHLPLRRAFGWGVLLISDGESTPPLPLAGGPVAATYAAVAVAVRHAQDVDYQHGETAPAVVNVNVSLGPADATTFDYDGSLELTSGVLAVGDAEEEETVGVTPGSYRVQIQLDDADYAQNVEVWLMPANK